MGGRSNTMLGYQQEHWRRCGGLNVMGRQQIQIGALVSS